MFTVAFEMRKRTSFPTWSISGDDFIIILTLVCGKVTSCFILVECNRGVVVVVPPLLPDVDCRGVDDSAAEEDDAVGFFSLGGDDEL